MLSTSRCWRLLRLVVLIVPSTIGFAQSNILLADYPTPGNPKSVAGRPILSVPVDPYMSAAEEQRILDTLRRPAQLQWVNTSAEYLAKELSNFFPCDVEVRAFEDLGLEVTGTLGLHVDSGSTSMGAKLIELLRGDDLTFIIRGGRMMITTMESAQSEDNMVNRVYDVSPLVVVETDGRKMVEFHVLTESIRSVVDPGSWEVLGGPATIYPSIVRDRALLSISATSVMHLGIQKYLDQLNSGPAVLESEQLVISNPQTNGLSGGYFGPATYKAFGGMGGQMSVPDSEVSASARTKAVAVIGQPEFAPTQQRPRP